jgi:hypothetical protein
VARDRRVQSRSLPTDRIAVMRLHNSLPVIVLLLQAIAVVGCCWLAFASIQGKEWPPTESEDHAYTIDASTILQSLDLPGDPSLRLLPSPDMTYDLPYASSPVDWTQADYLRLARALFEFQWGDSLDTWQLRSLTFQTPCADVRQGFQVADFDFFKLVGDENRPTRFLRTLILSPEQNFVELIEYRYDPVYEHWAAIDLQDIKITAEAALQIAEQNGGTDFRRSTETASWCRINTIYDARGFPGWHVLYSIHRADSSSGRSDHLDVMIDPRTGKTKHYFCFVFGCTSF